MASQVEENAELPAGFLNDEDGRFNAETIYGSPSDENLDKVKRGNGMLGFWSMMVFLGVLTIGFIYEWKKGALEWD